MLETNQIYNMDCMMGLKEIPDQSVDMVFTSPPYNRKRNDKYSFYSDVVQDYYEMLKVVCLESLRISKKWVFLNIQKNYYNKTDVFRLIGDFQHEIVEIIVWGKQNPLPASGHSITNSYEYVLVLGKEPLVSNTTYTKNMILTSINGDMPKEHKAVMKQEVADWFMEKFGGEGQVVVDPFMGLGTTAISAMKYGMNYIGFEISKEYHEMSLRLIKEGTVRKDITAEEVVPEQMDLFDFLP